MPVIHVSRRESTFLWTDVNPRRSASSGQALRGGNNNGDFHLRGWAAGPCALSRNSTRYSFPLSSLGPGCLMRPPPGSDPSPGPRRLEKAPSRSTLSPWADLYPYLRLDTGAPSDARVKPRRGELTQPRPPAWVKRFIPLGFTSPEGA